MTSDDQRDRAVRDYVQRRMSHEMPPDLISAIQREVDRTPQRRRGWALWAATAVTGIAVGVLFAAVLLSIRPADDIGQAPSATPSATTEPSATPEPTPSPAPTPEQSPTPTPSPSPTPPEGEFGPTHSMTPEEAFANPDECENPEAGYGISFPDEWYYNTAFDDFDACQWFAPTTFTVTDSETVPDEVAIVLSVQDGGDYGPGGEIVSREEYTVAGRPALRLEEEAVPGGFTTEDAVVWIIGLDGSLPSETNEGRWLMARTDTGRGGEFATNVDILDRMIGTLIVEEP